MSRAVSISSTTTVSPRTYEKMPAYSGSKSTRLYAKSTTPFVRQVAQPALVHLRDGQEAAARPAPLDFRYSIPRWPTVSSSTTTWASRPPAAVSHAVA